MVSAGLIPRKRLRRIPPSERLAHEYCYFLHDLCVQMLVEYEGKEAHLVTFDFKDQAELAAFEAVAGTDSAIVGLRAIGRLGEARRVVINTVTLAMVSDCMHHIYEALHCLEKRKFVVALNLLRKPLLDSLLFLSWMYGDEDSFYIALTNGSPKTLSAKEIGPHKAKIIADALAKTSLAGLLDATWIHGALFDDSNPRGLYGLVQKAVHLVTVLRTHVQTEEENFNLIFKRHADDDVYLGLYDLLPTILLYLTHVVAGLFDRMHPMDPGARDAFTVRTHSMLHLLEQTELIDAFKLQLSPIFQSVQCASCREPVTLTPHNLARLLMTESFRCTRCRRVTAFPFAWVF